MLLAWPGARTDWAGTLGEARACYREILRAAAAHQPVILLVAPDEDAATIRATLGATAHPVDLLPLAYDDTWVRDSGPLTFLAGRTVTWLDFRFDGWGGKFPAARDDALAAGLARDRRFSHLPVRRFDYVLEGGAVESDGAGTVLTTARCLAARWPALDRAGREARLRADLGARRVLWLEAGELAGDDTDGHVDTVARFADETTIVHQSCHDPRDRHYAPLRALAAELRALRTRALQPYRLVPLPLPSPRRAPGGERLPAGYANFLILNDAVLVPAYAVPEDAPARHALAAAFPNRRIVGVDCRALIRQGGSLHCASMQLPAGTVRSSA